MSYAVHPARYDQIVELTRGLKLPLSPLSQLHLAFIADMLARAWHDLLQSQHQTLMTGSEAEINALMETRLNTSIGANLAWSNLVKVVARGKETVSFDGSHLEKRPDLSIHLTDRNRNFPLVVECKLIELSSSKTVVMYCNNGLLRFVLGEYAWATCEAFMIAYVRDESSINLSLTPLLVEHQNCDPDPYRTECIPEMYENTTLDLARTRHGRDFQYVSGSPNDVPGPIHLWHLWVSTSS